MTNKLSGEQAAALKADILASADTLAAYTDGNLEALAALYNAEASPATVVWRTLVAQDEIMQNGFDWVRVDNLSVGKARIWEWLFNNERRAFNPSKPNVRAGIDEAWKGTAADLAVRAAVYVHCKRAATRIERLFSGAGSDAAPATMVVEGPINYTDFVGL